MKPLPQIEIALIWSGEIGAACLQSLWANRNPQRPLAIHIVLKEGESYDAAFFAHFSAAKLHFYPKAETFALPMLAKLVPEADKLLLLAPDTLIRGPLDELYDTELKGHEAAAVKRRLGSKPYDDGVLLLNLALLRGRTEWKLTRLLDLPLRWNLPAFDLYTHSSEWKLDSLNVLYQCSYEGVKQLYTDAVIYRYSGEAQPWKKEEQPFAAPWRVAYQDAPLTKHSFFPAPAPHSEPVLVSVVIPTYNVEGYIAQTLDSFLGQSLQDFEIICADDGSTDRTVEIIREYAAKHENIRLLTGPNVNAGYERNRGTEIARGKYIYFMDSDDLADPQLLSLATRYAELMKLDVLYFDADTIFDSPELEEKYADRKQAYSGKGICPRLYEGWDYYAESRSKTVFSPVPYVKLTRLSLLKENNIRFLEICQNNDVYQSYATVLGAKRVAYLPKVLYHRRIRENSLITNPHYRDVNRMIESRFANWAGICLLSKNWKDKQNTYFWILYAADRAMNELNEALRDSADPGDYRCACKCWKAEEIAEAAVIWQQFQNLLGNPHDRVLQVQKGFEHQPGYEFPRDALFDLEGSISDNTPKALQLMIKFKKAAKKTKNKYRGKLGYKAKRLKELLKKH